MMSCRALLIFTLLSVFSIGCNTPRTDNSKPKSSKKPSNIILLIGDGMGVSQLSSAYYFGDAEPNFSKFPTVGLSRTSASSHKITDSASGATAFASGIKTYNASIGMDADTNAVPTIVEQLSTKGWNTGVVATSSVTHATPACFYAHAELRSMQEEIARQMTCSELDFVAAGGYKWFLNRSDSVNYLDSLMAKGFVVDTTSINADFGTGDEKPVYLLAADAMPTMNKGRGDFLLNATQKAIAHLSAKPEPFFLMIEGSQIDWGGHANDADYLISELLDFDKMVGEVFNYAKEQGNTLVIITADHETGGFTLAGEKKTKAYRQVYNDYNSIVPAFSTSGHSGAMVPVLSFGPGSENLSGIYQNTHIYDVMMQAAKAISE
ncbi:alkaline phosphatase [bacterium]|nr:alkaline phosphatase [bacterium]